MGMRRCTRITSRPTCLVSTIVRRVRSADEVLRVKYRRVCRPQRVPRWWASPQHACLRVGEAAVGSQPHDVRRRVPGCDGCGRHQSVRRQAIRSGVRRVPPPHSVPLRCECGVRIRRRADVDAHAAATPRPTARRADDGTVQTACDNRRFDPRIIGLIHR